MKPLISVIIPVYNCEQTVELAIDSILKQTYQNTEIIVVDDKSTDSTKEKVRHLAEKYQNIILVENEEDPERFDVKLNRNINAGYSARNVGFKYAKGDLITFQDADDVSLLDRLEVQYELLNKHQATHITTGHKPFSPELVGTKGLKINTTNDETPTLGPKQIYTISQKAKGFIAKISPSINAIIPFHLKRLRLINKIFFGSLEPYPGAGNSPLFKREVIEKVKFRKLKDRVWPSFMGRGADRDFNFQVAETFKNSYFFDIPLYLWRK